MKLKALRLREVGRFSEPVQIEGFSGGLDVLIAPNEAGKSTLLKALKAVFFDKHTAAGQKLSGLRPYSGGAPLVEVDFEAGGGTWRLKKQFLSDRACLLTDLASARVVARGEDAHARALDLFAGGADSRDPGVAGFLLLEQRTWLEEAVPSEKTQTAIEKVLEAELATVAGLSRLRLVLASAREDLAKLVTPQQLKPTGALKASIERRDRLRARLEEARRAQAEVAGRQERLAALAAERAAHNDPARKASLVARARESAVALESAGKVREQLARAEAAYREHELSYKLAKTLASRANSQVGEIAALDKALDDTGRALSLAETALQSRLADAAEAQSKHAAAKARLESARATLEARHRVDRRAAEALRLVELQARLHQLTELDQARAILAGQLKSIAASERTLAAAEAEARAIDTLEARIAAGAPAVAFELLPGAARKVRAGGLPVTSGEIVRPSTALRIDIEGIGSVTVTPAQSDDGEADAADLDAHRRTLSCLLDGAGASGISELRSILERRRQLERELGGVDSRIRAAAPRGSDALKSELGALARALEAAGPQCQTPLPERIMAEAAIVDAEREVATRARECAAASEAVSAARDALSRLSAESAAARRRKTSLEAELPPVEERAAWLERLMSRLADADRGLKEASIERSAWREKAPDEQTFRRLAEAKASAEGELKRWAERREVLDREIAVLDSNLERDRETGHEAISEGLAQELAIVEREVHMQAADAAALRLLIDAATEVERGTRDALLRPVLERVATYLAPVLPGATVDLQAGLLVAGLSRCGRSEDIGALSQGTREQIAVLVRLGVARLLADAGTPRPFILDDVLVYSDDDRMSGMFENLRTAARHHQVIVLSCRGRSFEDLGGNRLRISPWRPQ
jgi:hypothetical protein